MTFALETYLAAGAVFDAAAPVYTSPLLNMQAELRDLAARGYFPILHPSQHDLLLETAKNELLAIGQTCDEDLSFYTGSWNVGVETGEAQAARLVEPQIWAVFRGCLTPQRLLLNVTVKFPTSDEEAKDILQVGKTLECFHCEVQFSRQQTVLQTELRFNPLDLSEVNAPPPFYREIVKVLRQYRNLAYFPAQESVAKSLQAIYARTRADLQERD